MKFLKSFIIAMALMWSSVALAQDVRVIDSTAPLVLLNRSEIDDSIMSDGQCVIVSNLTVGGVYVYDRDSTRPVDGAAVLAGPDGRGRLIRFIAADVDSDRFTVIGSGTAEIDFQQIEDAIDVLNDAGGGELLISGQVLINSNLDITTPISIRGVPGTDAEIVFVNSSFIRYNPDFNPFGVSETWSAITATTAKQAHIQIATGTLTQGQWFLVKSDDDLTGMTGQTGLTNRALEIHQVKEIRDTDSGDDFIVFDDHIIDALTTSPEALPLTPLDGVSIRDLEISHIGVVSTDATFQLHNCVNVLIHNVRWKNPAPNEIFVKYCGNIVISDCIFENTRDYAGSDGYRVVAGPVNRFTFTDSIAYGARHIFTTSADTSGTARYGTPRNVVVNNVTAMCNGDTGEPMVVFDTHGEGYGIIFQNCKIVLPADYQDPVTPATLNNNRGFLCRARNTIIRNCVIEGGDVSDGVFIAADNCIVEHCHFSDMWRGVRVYSTGVNTTTANGAKIIGNTFDDMEGPAIVIEEDYTGHIISKNICTNPAFADTVANIEYNAAILLDVDSGYTGPIEITFNDINGGEVAISGRYFEAGDIELVGNNLIGYAADTSTFTADAGTDVITSASHGLQDGQAVRLTTTAADLPDPLAIDTTYYVRERGELGDTFKLEATRGGGAIDITDAGTGTHSWDQTTDSGIAWSNDDATDVQTEADSYNWTD